MSCCFCCCCCSSFETVHTLHRFARSLKRIRAIHTLHCIIRNVKHNAKLWLRFCHMDVNVCTRVFFSLCSLRLSYKYVCNFFFCRCCCICHRIINLCSKSQNKNEHRITGKRVNEMAESSGGDRDAEQHSCKMQKSEINNLTTSRNNSP